MAAPAYLDLPGSADNATQVPCAFDFTSGFATSSAGEIPLTVTRAGVATRVNGQGLVEVVPANTLRLDYDPVTLACKGALIEESRTNLCLQSNAFNTTWGGTATAAQNATGPDGLANSAWTLTDSSAVAFDSKAQSFTVANNSLSYTFSIFVKKTVGGTSPTFAVNLNLTGGTTTVAQNPRLNTDNGAAGFVVQDFGNFWRASSTITNNATGNTTLSVAVFPASGPNGGAGVGADTAATTGSAVVYGAQLEAGAFATSYIPTTSAAVTRNADVPSVAPGSWFNAVNSAYFAEWMGITGASGRSDNNRIVSFGNDKAPLAYNNSGATVPLAIYDGTGGASTANTYTTGAIGRAACTFSETADAAIALNGGTVATSAFANFGTPSTIYLGSDSSGTACFLNGWLRKFAYVPKRLLNASLQTLSLNGLVLKQYTQAVTRARPRFSAPNIPDDTPVGLRQFLLHLKELVEVRNAELGSPLDSNPTYRDLIDTGLIKVSDNVPLLAAGREFTLDTKTWLTSNIPDWVTDNTDPPTPTGLIVVANTATLTLKWDAPSFANYKQTLIYRATSNNLSNAVVIGSNTGNTYVDDLPAAGTAYYYWIRHESKSELLSNFNSTNGTTVGNTPSAPTVGYAFAGESLVLSWTTPTSNLAVQYFEVSYGASPGANPVGVTQANTLRVRVDYGGTRQYWVRAIDINFGVGTAGTTTVTVNSPGTPSLNQTLTGGSLVLNITAGSAGSLPIAYYDLRYGASWAAGTLLGVSPSTRSELNVNWTGARTFFVVTVDTAGNQSSSGSATFTPALPAASTLTAQVIDNNVLLRWGATTGSLPIDHFNVYRDATLIGTDAALFAAVFESVAGTYVYKVEPVDQAGNIGSVSTTTAVVAQPPDFVLFSSLNSTFSGTKTTCFKDVDTGELIANVDPTETWQSHFTSRSWNTPQDQITAGYSRYLVGKTTGSYLEKVDYAATIPSTKITMTPTTAFSQGTVTQTPTLATSPDDITYTTYAGVSSVFATAFRYVKYKIDFAATHDGTGLAADTSNLIGINPLTYTLDVKLKTKEGVKTANSGDVGGTSVDITGMFIDVSSIILTPLATAARHATYDFVDAPNPTSFKILLWTDTGTRATGDVSWVVRGV